MIDAATREAGKGRWRVVASADPTGAADPTVGNAHLIR
jgi:hypothetical protein